MELSELGWYRALEEPFQTHRDAGFVPARVTEEHRERYVVLSQTGERSAEITGKLRFAAASRLDLPAVGDWAVIQPSGDTDAVIHAVLPRRTLFTRQAPGRRTEAQVVAANVDSVWIVTDNGSNFNPRRIERYLTLVHESGASPVVVLNKGDLCDDLDARMAEATRVASGAPVCVVSAVTGLGMDGLASHLAPGRTVALLGSSGVGKSSLINRLLADECMKTSAVRESDGRGRHTTTHRQLLLLPRGGLMLDTPGMRELQLWGDEASLGAVFEDIEELARDCRFSDCQHQGEPGCAIDRAIDEGTLSQERYESYLKLRRELRFHERKQNVRAKIDERARWKRIHKSAREHMRRKYGGPA